MQPESRFKQALDRQFDRLFPDRARSYRTSIEKGRGQKSGLPDRFYTAAGGHCWAEAKVHPNTLSQLQALTLERFARSGTRSVVLIHYPTTDEIGMIEYDAAGTPCDEVRWPMAATREAEFWARVLEGRPLCCPS